MRCATGRPGCRSLPAMPAPSFSARQRLTLLATGAGLFMIFLDATIVNVALPDIQDDFGTGEQGLQWVVAAYSLTMGMFIMSAATLADQRGRRRVFIAGTALFAMASALCGLAPSLLVLNIGRGLQGVGAATVNVASLALVGAAFPEPRAKARAIGIWTGIASLGLAAGPTVGGFVTETFGWRSVFFVNVAVGVVTVLMARAVVDESRDPTARGLDLRGQVLFVAAVGALTYALIEGPHSGWRSTPILVLLVGSAVLAVVFVVAELRADDPMMDVRVFGDRVYSVAIVTLFTVMFCIYGVLLLVTQYFQNVEDYSPEVAGVLILAFSVPVAVLSPISGRLAGRSGGRWPILAGVTSLVVGLGVMAAGVGGALVGVVVGLVLVGASPGMSVAPATNVAMSAISPDRSGMASGIMSAQRALGSTAGYAIMGSVLAAVVAASLPAKIAPVVAEPGRSEIVAAVAEDANPRGVASVMGPGRPLPDRVGERAELIAAADESFVEGIRVALAVGAGLAVVVLVLGYFVFPTGAGVTTRRSAATRGRRVLHDRWRAL